MDSAIGVNDLLVLGNRYLGRGVQHTYRSFQPTKPDIQVEANSPRSCNLRYCNIKIEISPCSALFPLARYTGLIRDIQLLAKPIQTDDIRLVRTRIQRNLFKDPQARYISLLYKSGCTSAFRPSSTNNLLIVYCVGTISTLSIYNISNQLGQRRSYICLPVL